MTIPHKVKVATVWGFLLSALTTVGCGGFNVPSGPGLPTGPSFRTATYVVTLIATEEPHPPRLQPNEVQVIPQKAGLLLTPIDGSAAPPIIEIARGVPPSSPIRVLAVNGNRVWIRAGGLYVYDIQAQKLTTESSEPASEKDRPFASRVSSGWRVSDNWWMGFYLPDDVADGKLKPGSLFMPGMFPMRTTPYEPSGINEIPRKERRVLYAGQIDGSGPIPRLARMAPVGNEEYVNGVVVPAFADSNGALIAYEGVFPNLTLHLRRIDSSGNPMWTADTRVTRDPHMFPNGDPQLLFGGDVLALRGVPLVPDGKFPQPILVLLDTRTGQMRTSELRW